MFAVHATCNAMPMTKNKTFYSDLSPLFSEIRSLKEPQEC